MALGRAVYPGLGDVMNFPDASLVGDAGPVKNPANTHIIRHADRYLALWEGGLPTEVTPDLDTVGEYDFGGKLRGGDDRAPPARPAHRRDVLLRLLGVRARTSATTWSTPPARSCTRRSSTCRRR